MTATECPSCHATDGRPHTDYCQSPNRGEPDVPKFRKKPVEIEAVQWTGGNPNEVKAFTGIHAEINYRSGTLAIDTLEGVMTAQAGDWIIKGIKGEFYPCRSDIFEASYESVEDRP